ncbi:MAG TPA: hypothetical protein VL461_03935, partial [Dictyobacter sp.]|nr:hypothetical protein [Dictyobacter sp.]
MDQRPKIKVREMGKKLQNEARDTPQGFNPLDTRARSGRGDSSSTAYGRGDSSSTAYGRGDSSSTAYGRGDSSSTAYG